LSLTVCIVKILPGLNSSGNNYYLSLNYIFLEKNIALWLSVKHGCGIKMILKNICDKISSSEEFSELIRKGFRNSSIEGISPSSFPLIISSVFHCVNKQVFIVTENTQRMNELYLDLTCFIDDQFVYKFPPWETLPYEFMSPTESIERDRIKSIYKIISGTPCVILATVDSILRKLPFKDFFLKKGLTLSSDEDYPFDDVISTLVQYGYTREPRVEAFGQFSVKGSIIDIHLPSHENPVRLDFFGDTLESIREFDLETQLSAGLDSHREITVYPRRELIFFSNEKNRLKKVLKTRFSETADIPAELKLWLNDKNDNIEKIPGIEDYFHEITDTCPVSDYLGADTAIMLLDLPALISRKNRTLGNYEELHVRKSREIYCPEPPELVDPEALDALQDRAISLQTFTSSSGALYWNMKSIRNYQGKIKTVKDELAQRISEGWRIILTTSFEGQARRLFDLFSDLNPGSDFENYNPDLPLNIVLSPLSMGLELNEMKTLIITDHEIFGKSYRKRKHFKSKTSRPIETFLDLKPGDYVVHINHGIGIFRSIERMSAGGVERDFILIDYADEDKLYVSLDQINLVQKYIGTEGRKPRIDSLGKKSAWNRIKQRVKESVEEIARDLIKIYSKRSALKGFRFPPDTQWQEEFESLFEFEETPDQLTAIEDVKDDMETDRPMDRLVCGDVGFGKTEVAIRASFKAVMAGRQVAMLVPTTILAMQHFETFKKRFQGYPVNIDMLSRF
jgi:transcription-repair coupling factor (superfamily II helicase)